MKGRVISSATINQNLHIENIEYLSNQDVLGARLIVQLTLLFFHCNKMFYRIKTIKPGREGGRVVCSFQIIIARLRAVWLFVGSG